jgi:hypothetical protein
MEENEDLNKLPADGSGQVIPPKPNKGIQIVGINLLILAGYTLIFKFIDGGMVLDAMLLALHFFTCLTIAIAKKSWMWCLAGILVLAIGFSTCVSLLSFNVH